MLTIGHLRESGQEVFVPLLIQMIRELGVEILDKFMLELKWEPKPEGKEEKKDGENEEKAEEPKKSSENKVNEVE